MATAAFLFDLDGTLWDSWPWYATIFQSAAGISPQTVAAALRGGQFVVALSRTYGISRSRLIQLSRIAVPQLNLYPGVVETLNRLADRGVPMGVVTNLPAWLAEPWLEAKSLDQLLSVQEYAAAKPRPAALIRARERIRRRFASEVYYVGDSDADAEAARCAGMPFICAAYGYGRIAQDGITTALTKFPDILTL